MASIRVVHNREEISIALKDVSQNVPLATQVITILIHFLRKLDSHLGIDRLRDRTLPQHPQTLFSESLVIGKVPTIPLSPDEIYNTDTRSTIGNAIQLQMVSWVTLVTLETSLEVG